MTRAASIRRAAALALVTCAAACSGLREVRPGVYRSPQPGEHQLDRQIRAEGIRTVVCLRGGDAARLTARAAEGAGATFVHLPMSAKRAPSPEALLALWHVFGTAERPLMLHCRAGVDRTGLASAIAVLHDTGDLDLARAELALIPNGHLAAFGTEAMDEVLERYAPYHGWMTFPQWVEQVWAPEHPAATAEH
jgi:uncharacterized protein (TIGR01244 family)